jgi:hypothetical protein
MKRFFWVINWNLVTIKWAMKERVFCHWRYWDTGYGAFTKFGDSEKGNKQ